MVQEGRYPFLFTEPIGGPFTAKKEGFTNRQELFPESFAIVAVRMHNA